MIQIILKKIAGFLMFITMLVIFCGAIHILCSLLEVPVKREIPFEFIGFCMSVISSFMIYDYTFQHFPDSVYKKSKK